MDKVQVPLPEQPAASSILVWDLPVRLGHGLMAAGFVIAWLTARAMGSSGCISPQERWCSPRSCFAWFGSVGSRTARFGDFVRGPAPPSTT